MKLSQNLNCIVTCENLKEQQELLDNFVNSYPNESYPVIRIRNSHHAPGDRYYNVDYYKERPEYKDYEFITFKEFKAKYMKEKFVLPEKWIVKPLSHQFKVVNDWAMSKSGKDYKNYEWHTGVAYDQDGMYKSYSDATITFEQFEALVLNQNKMKLIGYKLKNDKYKEAALKIIGVSDFSNSKCSFVDGSRSHELISEAGVLDLWFTPVYSENKPLYKEYTLESGFNVEVRKNGNIVTNDGTFTIKELDTKFGICFRSTKFNKWDMSVTKAEYKIGCQVVTHKDIIGINDLYKELNK